MAEVMEHVVCNVEAQILQRLHRESELIRQAADQALEEARGLHSDYKAATDEEQSRLRRDLRRKLAEHRQLEARAQAHERNLVNAVARAESVETGVDPGTLEPVRRVPLTKKEIAKREAEAVELGWEKFRRDRDSLLAASDWTQVPDAPVDGAAWAKYRQQLRDLPEKTKDPTNPKWPEPPK